jgi:nucleoid-associated protein YgaU
MPQVQSLFAKAQQYFKDVEYEMSDTFSKQTIEKAREILALSSSSTYTVRLIPERRDCLWRIAEYDFIYNDPMKWVYIWQGNLKKIEDPDLIFPGQVFNIPAK